MFYWVRLKDDDERIWTVAEKTDPDLWYLIGDTDAYHGAHLFEVGPRLEPPPQ